MHLNRVFACVAVSESPLSTRQICAWRKTQAALRVSSPILQQWNHVAACCVVLPGPDASKAGSTSTSSPMSRAQLWRQTKQRRAAEWAAFNASRPDETYDAPEDIAALQQAAATVGDFKLKSSPGFMLPEVKWKLTGHTAALAL